MRIASPPPGVGNTAKNKLQFLAHASSIPAGNLGEVRLPYFGRFLKIPGDRVFDNWTINIINDEDFALRAMFENWQNLTNALISNRMSPSVFPYGMKVDCEVLQYSKEGPPTDAGVVRSYVMQGAFPLAVQDIQLAWEQVNAVETFGVTFAYDDWIPGIVNTSAESYSPVLNPA